MDSDLNYNQGQRIGIDLSSDAYPLELTNFLPRQLHFFECPSTWEFEYSLASLEKYNPEKHLTKLDNENKRRHSKRSFNCKSLDIKKDVANKRRKQIIERTKEYKKRKQAYGENANNQFIQKFYDEFEIVGEESDAL